MGGGGGGHCCMKSDGVVWTICVWGLFCCLVGGASGCVLVSVLFGFVFHMCLFELKLIMFLRIYCVLVYISQYSFWHMPLCELMLAFFYTMLTSLYCFRLKLLFFLLQSL